jgi:hypothetical protein
MTKQMVFLVTLTGSIASIAPAVSAAPGEQTAIPHSPLRPVTWSPDVAGPKRTDLDQALDKRLPETWQMFDRKSGQRQAARTCRELLKLDPTSDPMEVTEDSETSHVYESDWHVYRRRVVVCRIIDAIQGANPAGADYLGAFALDNARLKEIPAALIPTPSPREEEQLKKASARGVSWKGWDRRVRVTGKPDGPVTVRGTDTWSSVAVEGRGDVDGDGIEDVILLRSGGGHEGTWRSAAGFVLTRRSPHGRVELVKVIE